MVMIREMKMKKLLLPVVLLLALSGNALADSQSGTKVDNESGKNERYVSEPRAEDYRKLIKGQLDTVKRLPIKGLSMAQSGDRVFFMSENGRFVFVGQMIDVWNGKVLRTPDDVSKWANRVDIASLGVDINDLNVLRIGTGQKKVTVFVDPECPYCNSIVKQMPALGKEYTFELLLLPLLGEKSAKEVKALNCMADKQKAAEILVSGDFSQVGESSCDTEKIQRSLIVAKVLGIDAVPVIINHELFLKRGSVKDLAAYLATGVTGYEESDSNQPGVDGNSKKTKPARKEN